ncbi:hypothetical protein Q9233_005602 [Columba guinea]|nr:hypothetical protein Q9233_005602 [Columba guinea]
MPLRLLVSLWLSRSWDKSFRQSQIISRPVHVTWKTDLVASAQPLARTSPPSSSRTWGAQRRRRVLCPPAACPFGSCRRPQPLLLASPHPGRSPRRTSPVTLSAPWTRHRPSCRPWTSRSPE